MNQAPAFYDRAWRVQCLIVTHWLIGVLPAGCGFEIVAKMRI